MKAQSTKRVDDIDREIWNAKVGNAADRVIARFLRGDAQGLTIADLLVLEHDVSRCADAEG